MIDERIKSLILTPQDPLIIKGGNVATVSADNTLIHAMMVLANVGYSSIPVIDKEQKLLGAISLPLIIRGLGDRVGYNWELLQSKRVSEIYSKDISIAQIDSDLEDILHGLVHHNYVCIVDDEQRLEGIITRKEILTRINFLVHEIGNHYELRDKKQSLLELQKSLYL